MEMAVGARTNCKSILYIDQKHTRKHMGELFTPQFMDRRLYNEWETTTARKVLTQHCPEALDPKVSEEMTKIIESVEK